MTTQPLYTTTGEMQPAATLEQMYEHEETRELVKLVDEAAEMLRTKGEGAFADFRVPDSRWRRGEQYVFVLDLEGAMLVHPDAALEGRNALDLRDVNGKPIIRGLIGAATALLGKPQGWYHYQWPEPGGMLPRWKSSYVRLVQVPSGKRYVVGCGMYNDRMERAFVVDMVTSAVGEIEKNGEKAFPLLRSPTGPFVAKDAYVFVTDMGGVEIVNPAFPNLEGRTLLDVADSNGKRLNREMIQLVQTIGSGWVDYMWPKPGESVPTQKSTYVHAAKVDDKTFMVGCGVYLADAPKAVATTPKMTASELMALVREAAALLEAHGEQVFPEFRKKDSKWLRDDTYFWVLAMDGTMPFNAVEPQLEGMNTSDRRDVLGRPFGRMIQDAAFSAAGEGWVHYMYPRPGELFDTWKSTFVKRVTFPSGTPHIVGCGIYDMQMERVFIEDVVNRAAALIEEHGEDAFGKLRDRTGPFVFMDTYVFVQTPEGTELVNPAQPSLEGKNLLDLKDLKGRTVVRDEIAAAREDGSAWLDQYWYKPGDNVPARKQTFVREVRHGHDVFIVGSGIYME